MELQHLKSNLRFSLVNPKNSIDMLKEFFWMCSGTDTDLLSECPKSEQIKFAGIGGTVFFTAVMAFIAASYALYTVLN